MLDNDLALLVNRDSTFDLSRLERDLWLREEDVLSMRAATRRLASWQAAVMVCAILGSAGIGSSLAVTSARAQTSSGPFSVAALAPSTLLFGSR